MTVLSTTFTPGFVMDGEEDVIKENFEGELDRRFFVHEQLQKVSDDLAERLRKNQGTFAGLNTFERRRRLRQAVRRVIADITVRERLGTEIDELGYPAMAAIAAAGGYNPEIITVLYGRKDVTNQVIVALRRLATEFGLLYSPMIDFTPSNVEMWIRELDEVLVNTLLAFDDSSHDLWLLTKWAAKGRNWLWNKINDERPTFAKIEIHPSPACNHGTMSSMQIRQPVTTLKAV